MPKANKEFVLNYTMNRWQLNFKKNVGPTSDSVRLCNPSSIDEWRSYYYSNIRSSGHIDKLGRDLYRHVQDDLPGEERFHPALIARITEQDCIDYMHSIVIERVFNGYKKERGER